MQNRMTLTEACQHLAVPYKRGLDLVLTGKISGRQEEGRWVVDAESVATYRARREGHDRSRAEIVLDDVPGAVPDMGKLCEN